MYLCILNHAGQKLLHEKAPGDPAALLQALAFGELLDLLPHIWSIMVEYGASVGLNSGVFLGGVDDQIPQRRLRCFGATFRRLLLSVSE